MGACVLTSLAMVADLSRVPIERMEIEVTGTRQDKPPSATYHLVVETMVPDERVVRLVEMAKKNSTVYQTLAATMSVSGRVPLIWIKTGGDDGAIYFDYWG